METVHRQIRRQFTDRLGDSSPTLLDTVHRHAFVYPTMWFAVLLSVMAVTNGSSLVKRAITVMPDSQTKYFYDEFHTTLMHIIAAEWEKTEPLAVRLKEEAPVCQRKMEDAVLQCENCMKETCRATPVEVIEAVGKEIGREIKGFFDDVGHGFVSWTGWDEMRDFFKGIGNKFLDWEGWGDMKDFFKNLGNKISGWSGWKDLVHIAGNIGEGFLDFGKTLGSGIKDIGSGIKDIGIDIGKGLKDLFSGGFWGRRKRSYPIYPLSSLRREYNPLQSQSQRQIEDEDVRRCAENCESCRPLLEPTPDEMVEAVCGANFVELNRTVQTMIHKLELLYNRLVTEKKPVITEVAYDMANMVGFEIRKVRLQGYFEDGVAHYESAVAYNLLSVPETAALMAEEYFRIFLSRP